MSRRPREGETRTSLNCPIHVDFLPEGLLPGTGRLGMTLAPGKKTPSEFGPPWDRDLEADLVRLREVYDTRLLICLLEDEEMRALQIPDLVPRAEAMGMRVLRFPVRDVSVPPKSAIPAYRKVVLEALAAVAQGETVVVHCRGGLGRAGTFAACILVAVGNSGLEALQLVRRIRPGAIETPLQERVVSDAVSWTGN